MTTNKNDLTKLRELLHSVLIEVEMALDTATYPDWTATKENLLKALEVVRKLERDQVWSKLGRGR
jgi:hypothetical protein